MNFVIVNPDKWISVKEFLPRERENVLIYGPFTVHTYDIKAAHYLKFNDCIKWYEPGSDPNIDDCVAYDHEVFYWRYYPCFSENE